MVAVAVASAVLLAGCSLLVDANDPATWLPSDLDGRRMSYETARADRVDTRPVCACGTAIEQAGGDLPEATVTRGAYGGEILVTALRAPGVAPSALVDSMLAVGQLEQRGQSEETVAGRTVTVLTLPSYTQGRAYLATARDTLVLIYADAQDLAFAYVRALP